jgi:predicted nucleic acid-binding protein
MFALDTNLLVYAHNVDAPFHKAAKALVEKVLNERDIPVVNENSVKLHYPHPQ